MVRQATTSRNILYLHIPKTGGCSIEKFLGTKTVDDPWELDLDQLFGPFKARDGLSLMLNHLTLNQVIQYEFYDPTDYIFTVVRNPYDRAVSQYFFELKHWDYIGTTLEMPDTFTGFLKFIRKKNLELDFTDQRLAHYLPQSVFTENNISADIDIFKFEDGLKVVEEALKSKFPSLSNSSIGHLNKNPQKKNLELTYENISLINEIFKDDFDRFGYELR